MIVAVISLPRHIEVDNIIRPIYTKICECTGKFDDRNACERGEKNNKEIPDALKANCRNRSRKVLLQIAENRYQEGVTEGLYPKD